MLEHTENVFFKFLNSHAKVHDRLLETNHGNQDAFEFMGKGKKCLNFNLPLANVHLLKRQMFRHLHTLQKKVKRSVNMQKRQVRRSVIGPDAADIVDTLLVADVQPMQ